jgi:hypothetical protein
MTEHRAERPADRGRIPWRSGRTVVLTVILVLTVPACLYAGWWQIQRARSGNVLSYGYMVEWPIFAVLAVAGWWQLVRVGTGSTGGSPAVARVRRQEWPPPPEPRWDPAEETAELRAYNAALAEMAGSGQGLPHRRLARKVQDADGRSQHGMLVTIWARLRDREPPPSPPGDRPGEPRRVKLVGRVRLVVARFRGSC